MQHTAGVASPAQLALSPPKSSPSSWAGGDGGAGGEGAQGHGVQAGIGNGRGHDGDTAGRRLGLGWWGGDGFWGWGV